MLPVADWQRRNKLESTVPIPGYPSKLLQTCSTHRIGAVRTVLAFILAHKTPCQKRPKLCS